MQKYLIRAYIVAYKTRYLFQYLYKYRIKRRKTCFCYRIQEDGNYAATVFFSNKTGYRIEYWGQSNELADIPRGVARAYFRMDMDTTG